MNSKVETLRKIPVERVDTVTPDSFDQRYLAGPGKPVVLTQAITSWKALSRWSFDFFKMRYGADNVAPRIFSSSGYLKPMLLGSYLDYLDAPEKLPSGLWLDAATWHPRPAPAALPTPLYLAWNVFGKHPELLEDIELSPKFVDDWLPLLPQALRSAMDNATRYFSAGLMIGARDSRTRLHYDFLHTHAYLAQIVGTKSCMLFSPEDGPALYDGEVNADEPDFEKFPLFRRATAYTCTLEPGELLFIPHRWWHHVVCADKSITVNYNFFNRVNFGAYMKDLLQDLPALVEGLQSSPDALNNLGIKWSSRGFEVPDSVKTYK
jgi:hypothetical protein